MLPGVNPAETKAWKELEAYAKVIKYQNMNDWFKSDKDRFYRYSVAQNGLLLDYSKNLVDDKAMNLLLSLVKEIRLKHAMQAFFEGEPINETENRPALHMALRHLGEEDFYAEGHNVMPEVRAVWNKMKKFTHQLSSGEWTGFTEKPITDIVNIGIGGSHLGPAMVHQALQPYHHPDLNLHFVSNVDGSEIYNTLRHLDQETTLFIVSSKSFSTEETMMNAEAAKEWLLEDALMEDALEMHFVAVTANTGKAVDFGISPDNIFPIWDWVGGRYSVWSAVGLPVACSIGFDNFQQFLKGGQDMDNHFKQTPFKANIPVILALLSTWYNHFFDTQTEAVVPYSQLLQNMPDYLQQLNMESNGKSTDRNGNRVTYPTAPVAWGGVGTNSQHAFFQLLHQGTRLVPCDFLAAANCDHPYEKQHQVLLANCFAQSEALMKGKTKKQVMQELLSEGKNEDEVLELTPHKICEGNKPSNTIMIKKLNPKSLGNLIAMYEHKVFVQGMIWNINSFDQWGVELGKQLVRPIEHEMEAREEVKGRHDASTKGLINAIKRWKKEEELLKKEEVPEFEPKNTFRRWQ